MRFTTCVLAMATLLTLAACGGNSVTGPTKPSQYGNPRLVLGVPIICTGPVADLPPECNTKP